MPNEKAQVFIETVGGNECFIVFFIAANGVGKTAAGCNVFTNIIYGPQSPWFRSAAFEWTDARGLIHTRPATPLPLYESFPYQKRARIVSDPTTLKEKIIPELKKWFPANESKKIPEANFETQKNGKFYESRWLTNTGFEIDLMSTEQELKEFESVDLGIAWFDEPMPKDRFIATVARMRRGGIIVVTLTPLFHSGWIKDWIDEKMQENKKGDIYCDFIDAEVEDNCKIHGVRGILEHRDIVRMTTAYTEDEYEARALGKFGHLIGRVHKAFRRKVHVVKPFTITENEFTVYHALDPHPRTPDHAMWLAVDKDGRKFICAELVTKGVTSELAERIKAVETRFNFRVEDRLIDPSAYVDDQHKQEAALSTKLAEYGLHYRPGSKDLQAGIKRTDEALSYEEVLGELVKAPDLYIFDTCPVTIKQIEEYVWDEYKANADEKKPKATPRDKNDHMPENMHRLLLSEPVFVPPFRRRDGDTVTAEEKELDPYE